MNHPTHDQWLSYVYGEISPGERLRLMAHLRTCPDCKTLVQEWQTVGTQLDAWGLRLPKQRAAFRLPVLRWAAAAALVLGIGIGLGRFWAASDVEEVRAAVEPEIRAQLRKEFAQLIDASLEQAKSETLAAASEQTKRLVAAKIEALYLEQKADRAALLATLNDSDARHVTGLLVLKRQLDTVAQNTAMGLNKTERQLLDLAISAQPVVNISNSHQQ